MLQTFARHGLAGMVASLLAMPVMAEPLSDDAANQLLQRDRYGTRGEYITW